MMKNTFEKRKYEKFEFVSYYCKTSLIFRFLKEDEKKNVDNK